MNKKQRKKTVDVKNEEPLFSKCLLKKQTSMKVVLNGGQYRLNDTIIPFQIGFNKEIADQKPKHILVIDVTRNNFNSQGEREWWDSS